MRFSSCSGPKTIRAWRSAMRLPAWSALALGTVLNGAGMDTHASNQQLRSEPPSGAGIYEPALDRRVDALLSRMTLEEKVGQLVQFSEGQEVVLGSGRNKFATAIAGGQIGALFNFTTAKQINAWQRVALQRSRLRVPLIFGLDVVHGFRTMFPIPLALASTWDPNLVEQASRIAAREAAASGIRWTFSPMVDIARDARWGRIAESAGEDPYLGSLMAAAYVRGYQGRHLDAADSIAACAKHFVGYGAAEGGRDYNTTEISEHTLREIYLPPFRAAVNAGAVTLMSAFNSLNGVPASGNAHTLTEILRNEWGFRGVVDSDYSAIEQLTLHGVAKDEATAARKSFLAGVDLDMASGVYHRHLAALVRSGQVPLSRLDESVRRVLRMKFALGLFERPYVDESAEAQAMLKPDAIALARLAAERSLVLLKNAPGADGKPILPLADRVSDVALIGPRAADVADALSASPARGRADDIISLRAALTEKLGASHLFYAKGSGITDGTDSDIDTAVVTARQADVVILALGESNEMSGEAASRAHLGLTGRQQELLEKVVATGKPVVLILFSGRPLTLPWAFGHAAAVIAAWAPGIQGGPALVRVLFGESEPGGRLVVTWPRAVGQLPRYYNALSTGSPLRFEPDGRESKFSSRYLDEQNSPQFPFGFGLSYSTFRYGSTELSARTVAASTLNASLSENRRVVTASAIVANTGPRPAETVVQLYVRLHHTSTSQPVRALKGFQRVALAAGESRRVSFDLPASAFAIWNIDNRYTVEPTHATVWVSADSASGIGTGLEVAEK